MEVLNHAGLDHLIHKISDSYNKLGSDIGKGLGQRIENTINITYAALVSLRDNANLKSGQQYRITDYVTTTAQDNTQSARNQFDIIVTADSTNTLNEEARACLHEGDTYFSNAGAKLEAWKIWYCLDNDTNRFAWAGASTPDINTYKLTIDGVTEDVVLQKGPLLSEGSGISKQWYYFNHTNGKAYTTVSKPDNNTTFYKSTGTYYPTINVDLTYDSILIGKGVIYRMIDEWNNDIPYDFKNIQFKHPKDTTKYPDYYYTFSTVIFGANNIITDLSVSQGYCYDNTMNKRISGFYSSTSSSQIQYLNNNVFIGDSSNICYCNSFGVDCKYNSFGNRCHKNSFGNGCESNSFGNGCESNSFGNNCDNNSFGNNCNNNSFGNFCYSNSFGNNCYYNSFGNNYDNNSFGNNCWTNSFGNYCGNNSFGNNCNSNSFGNYCGNNSFGNNCESNSFGNYCGNNSFRISADSASSLKDHVRHNHVDDGCSYNVIWNADTTSSGVMLKNINVNRGVSGNNSNYNFINIDTLSANYEIQVAKNSKGEIKIYCEADLIK